MRKLFRFFKGHRRDMILAPLFKVVDAGTDIVIPLLVANMIDIGVANGDIGYITKYGIIVIVFNIVSIVCALICQRFASRASSGIAYDMTKALYSHINTFSFAELDKFGTATLNNRLTHDVTRIRQAIGQFIRQVMRAPVLLIGSAIMAMIIDIKLSLIFLVVTPLTIGAVFLILKLTEPRYDKTQKDLDKLSEITRENLQGVRVVRAFNKQDYEEARFKKASKNLRKSAVTVTNISSLLNPITTTIMDFAIIAVIWFGGLQVNIGGLTQGQVIAFVNYMIQISAALVTIANIVVSFIKAMNCAKRVNEIFETKPSVIETNKEFIELAPKKGTPKIEFKNATFGYKGATNEAIKNLSIKINPGETIGIIGGTGSGKSSIINMIPRFYDASKGKVLIDGVDVKDYSFAQLRSKIGIVPQKAVLFKGTLKDNLRWRKDDASMEEMRKAVKISQSEEFVSDFVDKYDQKIQAGGKNLSGGQRQRLTIARALVGDPEILILDDSASALDFATDAALRKAIKEEVNSTVILVSQRANTVKNADKIIVLQNGSVVGIGKHNYLMKNCEVYKEIYLSQTK